MLTSSHSPSPPPRPPLPSTPGPRATALQKLYSEATTHLIKTLSYANFSSCFPTPSHHVPASLALLHSQFTSKLQTSMLQEFDAILSDRNVVTSLNELDALIEDARKRRGQGGAGEGKQPSHTLPARTLYLSHLAPTLREFEEGMERRERELGEENRNLMERIEGQRRDIERLVGGLERVVGDLQGSVEVLGTGEEWRDGNREVDEVMRG